MEDDIFRGYVAKLLEFPYKGGQACQLPGARATLFKISYQTYANAMLVVLCLACMGPMGLVEPAVAYLHLAISGTVAISYHEVVAQPPCPTPFYPVKVIKGVGTS